MVIHLITSLDVGGAEMALKKVISARRKSNFNDLIVCIRNKGKVGIELESRGCSVIYLNANNFFSYLVGFLRFHRILRQFPNALVQTWLYHADFLGGIIGTLNGRYVFWNIRSTNVLSSDTYSTIIIMRLCALLSYFIPHKIVCVAHRSFESHIKYGYCKKKFVIIPNGFEEHVPISLSVKKEFRQRLNIDDDILLVGTVGRFHKDKDYLTFIKSASYVKKRFNKVMFIMVGRNLDASNKALMSILSQYDIVDSFLLIGESNEVRGYLSIMDIFCLTSVTEGFPNVIGEAMYESVPCASTDCGDAPIIIGNTGCIVPVGDSVTMANELYKLLSMSDIERQNLGLTAHERIVANYLLPDIVNRYTALYESVN